MSFKIIVALLIFGFGLYYCASSLHCAYTNHFIRRKSIVYSKHLEPILFWVYVGFFIFHLLICIAGMVLCVVIYQHS